LAQARRRKKDTMSEPDVIYLQVGDDYDPLTDSFKESEDVTWCTDNQFGTDLTYCRIEPAELAALRDLLDGIRETRHIGSFAVAAHVKAVLELCEEQLAAALDRKPS
jgi:hypothetical protein